MMTNADFALLDI